MGIIERQDGARFVMQAYREILPGMTSSTSAIEIRRLSHQHGSMLCLMRHHGAKELEIAISSDSGYLLGECVWDHFGKPKNLIYCEATGESANCILVVVRNGSVYLDKALLTSEVEQELQPILHDKVSYTVYTYGDVPLRSVETFGGATFMLPKVMQAEFNHLKEPLLNHLLPVETYRLLELPKILNSSLLKKRMHLWAGLLLLVFLSVIGWVGFRSVGKHEHMTYKPKGDVNISQSIKMPDIVDVIGGLASRVTSLYDLAGWQVISISYQSSRLHIQLRHMQGDFSELTRWVKQHGYVLDMNSDGVGLSASLTFDNKKSEITGKLNDNLSKMMQALSTVLPLENVHVGSRYQQVNGIFIQRITINLQDLSPDLFSLIGHSLKHLPLSLSSAELSIKSGLIDGNLHLSLWGH